MHRIVVLALLFAPLPVLEPVAYAQATVDGCKRITGRERRNRCLQALVDAGRYETEGVNARNKGYDDARRIVCFYDRAGRLIRKEYRWIRNAADLVSGGASSCKAKDR
jgi:hypothetical protein